MYKLLSNKIHLNYKINDFFFKTKIKNPIKSNFGIINKSLNNNNTSKTHNHSIFDCENLNKIFISSKRFSTKNINSNEKPKIKPLINIDQTNENENDSNEKTESSSIINNIKKSQELNNSKTSTENKTHKIPEDIVTPWEVIGKVDYMKLVIKFGTELIDDKIISRFEKITNKPIHPWIRRNIFFTHRGLNTILNALENNEKIFLYTGRGPSSDSMHLGHLIPFIFTKWLQETLNSVLVIQISDEEKFAFKGRDFDEIYKLGKSNAKDIAAIGFDPVKTFIFSNRDYRLNCSQYEILTSYLKVHSNANEIKKIFGFTDEASIAMMDWPFYQTAAAYYQAYPNIFKGKPAYCLVPHAIDQDPYFRLARDLSTKVNKYKLIKPCNIMSKFVPPLTGDSGKMSSSTGSESTIFLNDSNESVREKVFKYTYSGGGGDGTLQQHKKFGGNADKDMAFQYLRYFEYDDEKLEKIKVGFTKGEISCSEIKEILCEKIIGVLSEIQKERASITDDKMDLFYNDKNKILVANDNTEGYKTGLNYNFDEGIYGRKKLDERQIFLIENLKQKYEIDEIEVKYHHHLSLKENEIELKNVIKGNLTKTLFLKATGNNYFIMIIDYDEIVDLKNIKKKLKLQSLKFGENDTIKHLFDVSRSEFGFLSALNLNEIKDKNFTILISEKLKDIEHLSFPLISENSHITIRKRDIFKIFNLNNYNFILV